MCFTQKYTLLYLKWTSSWENIFELLFISYGQLGSGNKSNCCSPSRVAEELGRILDVGATHYNHLSAATIQMSNKVINRYQR